MKRIASTVVALALVGLVALAARAKEAPGDREALQGTWKLVTIEKAGHPEEGTGDNERTLVFTGDHFQLLKGQDVVIDGTFKLDTSASPKAIDMKVEKANEKPDLADKTSLGIYELKGDELKWCAGEPGLETRPTAFSSEAQRTILAVFHREAKDAK